MAVIDATGRPPAASGAVPRPVRSRDPLDHEVPTGREEAWRFTPLRRLRGLLTGPDADGKVSVTVDAPVGVAVEQLDAGDARIGRVLVPADRVAAFAMARSGGATAVTVPAEASLTEPVTVRLHGEGGVAYGHLIVEVGPFASATVVLDHTGSATYASDVEVHVGHGASLTFVTLQDWDADAVHLGAHAYSVGRDATLRSFTVTLGGELVRLNPTVDYRGPGGDAELNGVFFTDAGQHQEHRLLVTHEPRSCRSRVTYKGALRGQSAHAVWIGDVLIGAEAVDTDTYELNRNLVLTDGARADSVPNLEILTGEVVGAGHASATGRFDDEALFYLQSRGIPPEEARRLVVHGFFAEVIDRIDVPELRERIMTSVSARLGELPA
ncbi:Iron-regulated ABC transporter permease protein SufD [Frankia canadensis]|uniref:Iron-regulated ABC transporter permease protein SufD n=1 Tax=Frankia canadensis TaxID=1836972 RepID=A0A2I2KIY4_9ACTN|nr:Fe-S cluster assembly protein SufD [Frankia canadensis]SNQ45629.1 Iron-regulated ABC transporter permease protein SufD [Frankia canadensis]SOU52919.1 Iron-regulated ABC transporter permease protein SufD [Frankia canadensis]